MININPPKRYDPENEELLQLIRDIEKLVEGKEIYMIAAALSFVLGVVFAQSEQDKSKSVKYVINTILGVYEDHANQGKTK
jgi:hypothetical protein